MLVHIFKDPSSGLHCATRDRSGETLPRGVGTGQWRHVRDVRLEDGEQRVAIDSGQAISEIEERGYHLLAGWYPRL